MEPSQPLPEGASTETPTQRQARLRRERREAKLKVEGSSRLDSIAKTSGRQNLPDPPPDIAQVSSDPEEIDLSTHPSTTQDRTTQQQSQSSDDISMEAELRAAMRTRPPQPGNEVQRMDSGEDPMMNLISQLMGGTSGGGNGRAGGSDGGMPPELASMLGGGGSAGTSEGLAEQKQDRFGYSWRIIHVICALSLGLYAATTSTVLGQSSIPPKMASGSPDLSTVERPNLFFAFVTGELVLQSSRLFLEKSYGRGKLGGLIGLVAGFLPEPYRRHVVLLGRYARIWGTVVEDAMVIVFVVGCMAWWKPVDR